MNIKVRLHKTPTSTSTIRINKIKTSITKNKVTPKLFPQMIGAKKYLIDDSNNIYTADATKLIGTINKKLKIQRLEVPRDTGLYLL